jgi:hypothetical protein
MLLLVLGVLVASVLVAALGTHWWWYANMGYPKVVPGPWQVPVLGHLPQILPHQDDILPLFLSWARTYVVCSARARGTAWGGARIVARTHADMYGFILSVCVGCGWACTRVVRGVCGSGTVSASSNPFWPSFGRVPHYPPPPPPARRSPTRPWI